ncbi:hypothetical protein ENHAE0001_0531 [Enhydrobacter aerosaccus SK60]|nr:hypothetical protein ENHAE0001_0531 [Enhydrobacter aerosaccus SK60]
MPPKRPTWVQVPLGVPVFLTSKTYKNKKPNKKLLGLVEKSKT